MKPVLLWQRQRGGRVRWGPAAQVKEYVERQWTKILSGRVSLADFVFAKEVRLGTYRGANGLVPPAAQVASRALANDPRAEPRYGERVPYVVVHGEPGAFPSGRRSSVPSCRVALLRFGRRPSSMTVAYEQQACIYLCVGLDYALVQGNSCVTSGDANRSFFASPYHTIGAVERDFVC